MELSHEQEAELKSVLASNPDGISYVAICESCYSFEDLPDVSRALRNAVNLGIAYKEGKLYYDLDGYNKLRSGGSESPAEPTAPESSQVVDTPVVDTPVVDTPAEPDPVTAEIKKLLGANSEIESVQPVEVAVSEPKVVQSSVKRTVVAPLQTPDNAQPKVNGNLRRTKNLGAAAMALYKFRNERPLTLEDLSLLIGLSKIALSGVMSKLVDAKYAIKSGAVRYPEFKWSGNFAYPFDQYSTEDSSLVLHSVISWKRQTNQSVELAEAADYTAAEPATQPEARERYLIQSAENIELNGSGPSSITEAKNSNVGLLAIQQIDIEIQMFQQQIESLRRVRDRISGLLQ